MLMKERQRVVEPATACHAPAPGQRLIDGAVIPAPAPKSMQKRNPRAEWHPKHGAGFRRVDKLRAALAHAIGVIDGMLPNPREVATLHRDSDVSIEIARDAHGSVHVVDVEVLFGTNAAIYRVEVAISAVDIDP